MEPLPASSVRSRHALPSELVDKIASDHGPLLVKHGDADEIVPFALGKKLFAAANEPKQFITIPGGKHNDLPSREYLTALDQFLGSLPARH